MKREMSLQADAQIAARCGAAWETMDGAERVRFCSDCQRSVFQLDGLSDERAAALIVEHEGRHCGKLYRRDDGRYLTQDCPSGVRELRRIAVQRAAIIASAAAFIATAAIHPLRLLSTSVPNDRPLARIELADLEGDNLDVPGALRSASALDFDPRDLWSTDGPSRNVFIVPFAAEDVLKTNGPSGWAVRDFGRPHAYGRRSGRKED